MADDGTVVKDNVQKLRTIFEKKFAGSISNDDYEEQDLERFSKEDAYTYRFLLHQKQDFEKAAAMVDTSFKWRKSMGIMDLNEQYFPRWMHELGAVFYHNMDKDGQEILHLKVAKCKKDPENQLKVKKYLAWLIEKQNKKAPDQKIVVLFDMTGAGLSNMDLEVVKFLISCFSTYFPAYLAYMLIYEMPWVLNAIWKIIKNLLNEEQQKHVIFVKKAEIQKYIDTDNLFVHMGGKDTFEYNYLPSEDSGIEIPNGDVLPMHGDPTHFSQSSPSGSVRKRVTFSDKEDVHPIGQEIQEGEAIEAETTGNDSKPQANNVISSRVIGSTGEQIPSNVPQFTGSLAKLSPAEQFSFNVTDETKETLDFLTITNIHSKQVAYKVKATSPDSYRVRPISNFIKPGESKTVNIYLQPGCYDSVMKDKFLVMVMEVEDGLKSVSEIGDRWKNPPRDSSKYMEHRLYCAMTNSASTKEPGPPQDPMLVMQDNILNMSKQMEEMLQHQQQLEQKFNRLLWFQIMVVILVSVVILMFTMLFMWDWKTLDAYSDLIKSCTPSPWRAES